jgi:hypothetical protein
MIVFVGSVFGFCFEGAVEDGRDQGDARMKDEG